MSFTLSKITILLFSCLKIKQVCILTKKIIREFLKKIFLNVNVNYYVLFIVQIMHFINLVLKHIIT